MERRYDAVTPCPPPPRPGVLALLAVSTGARNTGHRTYCLGAGGLSTLNTGSRCHGLDARHCTGAGVGQPSPGHEVTGSSGRGRSLHQPREATCTSVGTRPGQHGHHGHPRGQASTRLVIRIDSCDRDGQLDKNQYCCEKVCSRLGCALTAEQWAVSPLHPAPPRPRPAHQKGI